jgi:ribonuclease P protein component
MAGTQVPGDTHKDRAAPQGDGVFTVSSDTPRILTLKRRADFLAAARARHRATAGFIVQARARREGEPPTGAMRVGFTCSKKVGNAVARNRAKRRLRALARDVLPRHGRPGWDYVLIGRAGMTATREFASMQAELAHALGQLHGTAAP